MLRAYLRTLDPLLQTGGIYRPVAPGFGGQAWRRTFVSKPQSCLQLSSSKPAQAAISRKSNPRFGLRPTRCAQRSNHRPFHNTSRKRNTNPNPNPESKSGSTSTQEPQGLSARLRKLSREYGWSALGVYLALSVLDFPFCFLLVRIVGTERIGNLEHFVVSNVKKIIPPSVRDRWHEYTKALKQSEVENLGNDEISEHVEMAGWGVEEAEQRNKAEASLGTQLALAYAIHKSFIFIRVPLTAAVTPKVVKVLRSWGWNIGKRRSKP
ncbi:peptide alpha-N-acetyltransferase Nat2 [Xylariaceae sp. FL0016]|nr:peptide alpha-N-acetyltransferase Nat2 [Xylariaceae sp. FL0016]